VLSEHGTDSSPALPDQDGLEIAAANCPARSRKAPDRLIESIGFLGASSALEQPNIPSSYEAAIADLVYLAE